MTCAVPVFQLLRCAVFLCILVAGFSIATGQAPAALGPPTFHSTDKDISVGVLTRYATTLIEGILSDTNASFVSQHQDYRVSLVGTVKANSPYRLASENPDRPNQYYVKLPMNFTVNVSIPHTSDRQLYYPLDINVTCDQWYTGYGTVNVTAVTGPPDIQGGNVIENLLNIRNMIDAQVKSKLPQMSAITQTFGASHCYTIGPQTQGAPSPLDSIVYDAPARRPVDIGGAGPAFPRLEVTLLRLKRLPARGNGALLYQPVENIKLDVYADFAERQSNLTMREGDDVALNVPKMVLNGSMLLDGLVVIANIDQQTGNVEDTAFTPLVTRAANYGVGTHTIQITKSYIIPPGHGSTKPVIAHTPAYELTYSVAYFGAVVSGGASTTTRNR